MKLAALIPILAAGALATQAAVYATKDSQDDIRPPGAGSEEEFISRCIRCARCVEACPHVALIVSDGSSGYGVGTPTFDMRAHACRLCVDFPCIEACPTEALSPVEGRAEVDMGLAVIDNELCIAMRGNRCEVCYRICPLIDKAITIDYRLRDDDSTHAVFAPVIDEEQCVGCGLCVERCVVSKPRVAIKIVKDRAQGIEETRNQKQVSSAVRYRDELS